MDKLIVTLPSLRNKNLIDRVMGDEVVHEARYNTGINELYDVDETIVILNSISKMYKKRIWLDLKGRQLRITSWADPRYEVIELNHEIEIEYPACIIFRGEHSANIAHTRGNKIVLQNPPMKAVGKGQSVNIIAKSLDIKGYLTERDKEFISKGMEIGMNDYMASFVEGYDDIQSILSINKNANIISKIESLKGIDFIRRHNNLSLMAAREDLFIENIRKKDSLELLRLIISKDENAICASRIFSSLTSEEEASLSDYEDIELMKMYGYKNFMLGDELRDDKLLKALKLWKEI